MKIVRSLYFHHIVVIFNSSPWFSVTAEAVFPVFRASWSRRSFTSIKCYCWKDCNKLKVLCWGKFYKLIVTHRYSLWNNNQFVLCLYVQSEDAITCNLNFFLELASGWVVCRIFTFELRSSIYFVCVLTLAHLNLLDTRVASCYWNWRLSNQLLCTAMYDINLICWALWVTDIGMWKHIFTLLYLYFQREHFFFLRDNKFSRSRTTFFYAIGLLVFAEDSNLKFKSSLDPLMQVC